RKRVRSPSDKTAQPTVGSVDNQFIDMSRFLQAHPSCVQQLSLLRSAAVAWLVAIGGCGAVVCPEPLVDVDGACQKLDIVPAGEPEPLVERCDGVDNDGDNAVDEDWPELGEACGDGAGIGECVAGEYVCAEGGMGVVCEGAVGPTDEVCDGKDNDCDGTEDNGPEEVCDGEDNDCDGLIDEGVLSIKDEVFGDYATVTAVDAGFVLARLIGSQVRVETYDTNGDRTGHHDDVDRPNLETTFLDSDSVGKRVLIAFGKHAFHVLDVDVDSALVPIIVETRALHEDWNQPRKLGVYDPPYHPRVVASPSRFVGYRDLVTFALNPFAIDNLLGLAQAPTVAMEVPLFRVFDAAGTFVVWEQSNNVRAGWLLDDGVVVLDIDVARGHSPSIALGKGGPGLLYLQDGRRRLSELAGLTLLCLEGRFCGDAIEAQGLQANPTGPTALAYDEAMDTWFVATGTELLVVGRGADGPAVKQVEVRDSLGDAPNRIDVAVSGGTAAFVQSAKNGESALTFLGCF
ncbi:MAG: hypothetical protein JRG67_13960, partial [Deltaproteobacteria bacterium]|nr:hypothetical protein [Deltaproteobacteria bacterium]